ncbi:MAG: hypothetical protein IJX50_00105 [Clostridia bacterium]|nr:hypothetical protein [Clostridia bacterium]
MKKITALLLAVLVLLPYVVTATEYVCTEVNYPIYVNGVEMEKGDLPALNYNGNTYIPMRKIGEGSGLTVEWDEKNRTAEIYNGESNYFQYCMIVTTIYNLLKETRNELLLCQMNCYDAMTEGDSTYTQFINYSLDTLIPSKIKQINILLNALSEIYGLEVSDEDYIDITNRLAYVNIAGEALRKIANVTIGYTNGIYSFEYAQGVWNTYSDTYSNNAENIVGGVNTDIDDILYELLGPCLEY